MCKREGGSVWQKETRCSRWQVVFVHVWVMFLFAYAHVCMCRGAPLAVFMTQRARGCLKMDDVLLQFCRWCVNNREIFSVINHEGTAVCADNIMTCNSNCGGVGPGLAAPVWTCGLSAEVAQVWTSQDSSECNLLIFHLIYHNLNPGPSWWPTSPFSWPYTPYNILVIRPFESYFLECWYKCNFFDPFCFIRNRGTNIHALYSLIHSK